MRLRLALFLLASLPPISGADLATTVWQPPGMIPRSCASTRYEVLLFDISKSMDQFGRLEGIKRVVADYVATAMPECSLAIIASFGMTADVIHSEFISSSESRSRVTAAFTRLRATHRYTNLDEAAKLIQLICLQLREAYGAPAQLVSVRVYTDDVSAPSPGKPPFSLSGFLSNRLNTGHTRVSVERLTDGFRLEVGQTQPLFPASENAPEGGRGPGIQSRLGVYLLGGLGLVALAAVVMFWVRSQLKGSRPAGVRGGEFLVTEIVEHPKGETFDVISRERRIPVAANVPAVFSTDAHSATYVAALVQGGATGELFRIVPLPDGLVRIQSPHPRLTVNEQPLDVDLRVTVDLREPIRIRLGPREFSITGVFEASRSLRHESDVFDAEALRD